MRALRNIKLIGLALAVLTAVGTAGFHFIEGWPWFDGFYMVLTTFTTIGYQEVHPLSHTGRVFNVALIVAGVALVFLGIGSLTQALLEFELGNYLGRRKMQRDIGRLSGHYIICGAGRVGRSAARELARKPATFVIIEADAEKGSRYADEFLVLVGDATQEEVLRHARIEQALGLVAATTLDATNIYIVLTARGLNPRLKIIARASEEAAEKHLLTAGADSVISPYLFAGHRIAQSFLRPNVVDFLDVATARAGKSEAAGTPAFGPRGWKPGLEIEEVRVAPNSIYVGKTLEASRIRQDTGVMVLAIHRGNGMRFNPAPEDRIEPGDCLIALGEPAALARLEQSASSA